MRTDVFVIRNHCFERDEVFDLLSRQYHDAGGVMRAGIMIGADSGGFCNRTIMVA